MDFKLNNGEQVRTVKATKASATVIEAGDLVAIASGLIIKATATSAAIAYAPNGAGNGETEIDVTVGNDFTLVGTADANFAVTDKGGIVDVIVTNNVQLIDLGESSIDVLKVGISQDSGTVGSTSNIEVKINKYIF